MVLKKTPTKPQLSTVYKYITHAATHYSVFFVLLYKKQERFYFCLK